MNQISQIGQFDHFALVLLGLGVLRLLLPYLFTLAGLALVLRDSRPGQRPELLKSWMHIQRRMPGTGLLHGGKR